VLHGHHHPVELSAHPLVGLEEPVVDLAGEPLAGPLDSAQVLEGEAEARLVAGDLWIPCLADQKIDIL